jgi:LCP family protein required for cell wall assembly
MPAAETPPPATPPHSRRTWPERVAIGACILAATVCFAGAGSLLAGKMLVGQREVVEISNPAERVPFEATGAPTSVAAEEVATGSSVTGTAASTPAPPATFPDADPDARNFLITGADNGACIDPGSPFAPAFGDRSGLGERSDTIMIFRVDPQASRVAVLSLPRDLWVTIAGSGTSSRINSAYERNNPQRLIDTIFENFGIGVDHFIQVDFCAFKTLVDAVGGVAVPFDFPARDAETGLNVPRTGCFRFNGEHALAYVRSRHYEYEDPPGSGEWQEDGTSDLGRISRQQDFLRRTLSSVLAKGTLNPRVARGLIEAATRYVVTDSGLSPRTLLQFAGVLNRVDPEGIVTYQVEASDRTIGGAAVLEPRLEGENMQSVLQLFRGETSLEAPPEQVLDPTTTPATRPNTAGASPTTDATNDDESDAGDTTEAPESTSAPSVTPADPDAPAENTFGIVPPRNVTC